LDEAHKLFLYEFVRLVAESTSIDELPALDFEITELGLQDFVLDVLTDVREITTFPLQRGPVSRAFEFTSATREFVVDTASPWRLFTTTPLARATLRVVITASRVDVGTTACEPETRFAGFTVVAITNSGVSVCYLSTTCYMLST
jgi:hypothetical protein